MGVRGEMVATKTSGAYPWAMATLAPTPPEKMVDAAGRPYFLWDDEMSMEAFRAKLRDPDPEVRAYFVGKLMRQAKPDDVFSFVALEDIGAQWALLERYLGKTREFWRWLLGRWAVLPDVEGGGAAHVADVLAARGSR
jgi:hypothetical protein